MRFLDADMSQTPNSRRQFLRFTGAAALATSLAGCGGRDGDRPDVDATNSDASNTGGESEPVPESERTAKALGGIERDPDALQDPAALSYQSTPNNGQQCTGCQYYVPDGNDDGMGACTLVSGQIDPEGWCLSYAAYSG